MEANAAADITGITLPAGSYILSLDGAREDAAETGGLDISGDLILEGAGADITIVDGGTLDRVFHIVGGSTAGITGLTVRNGDISGLAARDGFGGGILNRGMLTLTNLIVIGNSVAAGSNGGGIYNAPCGTCPIGSTVVSMTVTGQHDQRQFDGYRGQRRRRRHR